jgi:hypothetical protein
MTSFLGMADGTWEWTGTTPRSYQSSPGTWREFCPVCGTQMAFHTIRIPGERHFYAATLDDPAAFAPTEHDHSEERLPWLVLCDGLPQR